MVVGDQLHFADPSTFNAPLDTRPSLDDDVDESELGRILRILIERSTAAEMRTGAKAMKLKDSRTRGHCQVNRIHSEISVNCRWLLYAISMA